MSHKEEGLRRIPWGRHLNVEGKKEMSKGRRRAGKQIISDEFDNNSGNTKNPYSLDRDNQRVNVEKQVKKRKKKKYFIQRLFVDGNGKLSRDLNFYGGKYTSEKAMLDALEHFKKRVAGGGAIIRLLYPDGTIIDHKTE